MASLTDQAAADDAPPPQAAPQEGERSIRDPLLKRAEMAIEAKLTPQNRPNYNKIVTAGLKVALQKGPQGLLGQLMDQEDIPTAAAKGAVTLVAQMARMSRGTMPYKAAVPAAATLMILALDTAERAGAIQVDEQTLAAAMKKLTDYLFQLFKISNADLNKGAQMASTVQGNPELMQAVNQQAGVAAHPSAEQTPLPHDQEDQEQ